MSRIAAIKPFGQRIWLDNLSRGLIKSGELAKLLQEDGIAGVTSNPAIFYKSISSDALYAGDLAELKKQNLSAEQRYEALVVPDIQATCDLTASIYRDSNGLDGYVSLEVSPALANDAAGTIENAKRLWAAINRPNAMIKVPATPAGVIAFEELITSGINVNVTLMFNLVHVDDILNAYVRGLEARVAAGQPIDKIQAVASVFLSRVDTLIDKKNWTPSAPLKPRHCKARSPSPSLKWLTSTTKKAVPRRPFCCTEGQGRQPATPAVGFHRHQKNAAFRDTMYVEELIGPETVNTVPDATLDAFRDHGVAENKLDTQIEESVQALVALRNLGINYNLIGEQLQVEGLKLFDEAFDKLLQLTA